MIEGNHEETRSFEITLKDADRIVDGLKLTGDFWETNIYFWLENWLEFDAGAGSSWETQEFMISRFDAEKITHGLELAASWDKTEIYYRLNDWLQED